MLQIQIDENKTLFELDNQFCASEVYLSSDVIKPNFKLTSKFERDKNNIKSFKQEGFKEKGLEKSFGNKQNFKSDQFKQNFNGNNSGRFKQNFQNSGQFRNKVEN